MSAATGVAASGPGATISGVLAAGAGGVVVVRAPIGRIDFRTLLREDAIARVPAEKLAPGAQSAAPAPVVRSFVAPSAAPRASPGHAALDRLDADTPGRAHSPGEDDPLDPFARHHAALASPDSLFPSPCADIGLARPAQLPAGLQGEPTTPRAVASLEDLLPALVRRVAYSGDGRRGTVRLELGAGRLAGSTLLVHADGGRVRVHLDVPSGTDPADWQQRIEQRLGARGIALESVEVT